MGDEAHSEHGYPRSGIFQAQLTVRRKTSVAVRIAARSLRFFPQTPEGSIQCPYSSRLMAHIGLVRIRRSDMLPVPVPKVPRLFLGPDLELPES